MITIKNWIIAMSLASLCYGCNSKKKLPVSSADFALGKINMINTTKQDAGVHELKLMSRFELRKSLDPEFSNYFQYHLGDKIKLIIDQDTLKPVLSNYIPLVNELVKEIDCTYILQAKDLEKPKKIIIDDSILDLNKVAISLK